jgi:hypothetical protein
LPADRKHYCRQHNQQQGDISAKASIRAKEPGTIKKINHFSSVLQKFDPKTKIKKMPAIAMVKPSWILSVSQSREIFFLFRDNHIIFLCRISS